MNAPIKSNILTLALWLESSAKKYFRVLVDAVGDQVFRKCIHLTRASSSLLSSFLVQEINSFFFYPPFFKSMSMRYSFSSFYTFYLDYEQEVLYTI